LAVLSRGDDFFDEIDPDQWCRHAMLAIADRERFAISRTVASGFDVLARSTAIRGSLVFNGPPCASTLQQESDRTP